MAENSYTHWYGTQRWRRHAKAHLATEPLCRMCLAGGEIVAATVCDHVHPHRGDERAFWSGPFQSLCTGCHSGTKQRQENGRQVQHVDDDGWPVQSG